MKWIDGRHYFTGEPCLRGHVSLRLLRNGDCLDCRREYAREYRRKNPGKKGDVKAQRRRWYQRQRDKPEFAAREAAKREARRLRERDAELYGATRPKPDSCECCHRSGLPLVFDHDHESGLFRGWVCNSCNVALGHFRADKGYLVVLLAIDYLQRAGESMVGHVESWCQAGEAG